MPDLRMNGNTSEITPNSAVMEMARLSRQLDELGFRLKTEAALDEAAAK